MVEVVGVRADQDPTMMDFPEKRSVISGIGISRIGRRTGIPGIELTQESALAAIADAGLTPADIDARCRPSLAEGVEVAQNRVQRRIRSPSPDHRHDSHPTCELMPVLGRCRSDGVLLVETAQASDDSFAGPPRASKGPPRRRRMHALRCRRMPETRSLFSERSHWNWRERALG